MMAWLPYEAKQGLKWVYGFLPTRMRYGGSFLQKCRLAEEREKWTAAAFTANQNEQLRCLIDHAYRHVPYYRILFDRQGIDPAAIRNVEDLQRIPPLTKDDLRNHFSDLIAANIKKKDRILLSTSGTSGRPLRFYSERRHEAYLDGDAYRWRHFRWGGCTPYDRRATLSAYRIPAQRNGERRLTAYDPVKRLLILSAYDLSRTAIPLYARALQKHRPSFLHGYPSALEALTRFLQAERIPSPPSIRALFTQSEVLYPWQRALIESYFGCKIFDWYGMEERVIAAAECEQHSGLHVFTDYCIVETLQQDKPVTGVEGEIVSTRLDNFAMPLIRYRTGDMGTLSTTPCACGRNLPLLHLHGGRDRNLLIGRNGELISITVVDIPHATAQVEQFQFLQQTQGEALLRIVRKSGYSDHDFEQIQQELREKFAGLVDVTVEYTKTIERTGRGKLPLLIQRLPLDHLPHAPV